MGLTPYGMAIVNGTLGLTVEAMRIVNGTSFLTPEGMYQTHRISSLKGEMEQQQEHFQKRLERREREEGHDCTPNLLEPVHFEPIMKVLDLPEYLRPGHHFEPINTPVVLDLPEYLRPGHHFEPIKREE